MNGCPYNSQMHWLSQEEYQKAVTQLRLQLNGVFEPFDIYGLGAFIPSAVMEAVKLCEDFGLRVRGIDKPLSLEDVRNQVRNGEGNK